MSQFKSSIIALLTLVCGCSGSDEGVGFAQMNVPGQLVTASAANQPMEEGASSAASGSTSETPNPAVAVIPPENSDVLGGDEFIEEVDVVPAEEQNAECASSSMGTSLVGVVLAFTFDVSASMGSHFEPYYSRALKWDPVVAATKAFFADTTSAGVSATLTFFPNDLANLVGAGGGGAVGGGAVGGGALGGGALGGGGGGSCDAAGYEQPDVGLTELPSDAFGAAIDAVTPAGDDDWRLGTPTGPALEGTIASIEEMRATEPNAKYVIVLVTDGEPALCSDQQDDINNVAGIVQAVAAETPTYVIGLGNPVTDEDPDPPTDGIDNLHAIAAAGGTGEAFLIDTSNPAQTSADFRAVIDSIRENSFSCELEIPTPPDGEVFDSTKVNVNYTNTLGETPFTYDPSCTEPFAWYYDDEANPSVIHMCDAVCQSIKDDYENQGQLNVEFGCVSRIPGSK